MSDHPLADYMTGKRVRLAQQYLFKWMNTQTGRIGTVLGVVGNIAHINFGSRDPIYEAQVDDLEVVQYEEA